VGSGGRHAATVQIILPAQDGCIVRADIIRQRLATSKSIERVEEFVSLDQHMTAFQESQGANKDLLGMLSYAAGAILEQQHIQRLPSVNQELQARLSFPWICQLPRISPSTSVVMLTTTRSCSMDSETAGPRRM
jgi:hypothetical protein